MSCEVNWQTREDTGGTQPTTKTQLKDTPHIVTVLGKVFFNLKVQWQQDFVERLLSLQYTGKSVSYISYCIHSNTLLDF